MWYVMQVVSGQESRTVLLLERMISEECLEQCFVPMRRLAKKFHGTWNEVTERLFPGYVFLVTERPQLLYEELKHVPALTKILGKCEEYFTPLPGRDVKMLQRIQAQKTVEISQVAVEEGNSIRIISGPLQNMKGKIKKINLHKRIPKVEMDFMGSRRVVYLGIEIMEKSKPQRERVTETDV